jgi:hypothetical protein
MATFKLPLLFLLFLLLPSANSVSFQISCFESNTSNKPNQGDVVASDGAIEMNMVNYVWRVGWANYAERVPLWDSNSGNLSDFTIHFSFLIDHTQAMSSSYDHGHAFFLASVGFEIPPNSGASFLGLFNTTSNSSQNQTVLVEFDSSVDPNWDHPVEHVRINNNSIASAVYTPWNVSSHNGAMLMCGSPTMLLPRTWASLGPTKALLILRRILVFSTILISPRFCLSGSQLDFQLLLARIM